MNSAGTQAISYRQYGKPLEVLAFEDYQWQKPGPLEAKIALRSAVINPSDFGLISGRYGRRLDLPTVAGREGVGEVIELGSDVANVNIGTIVRMPEELGVWQQVVNAPAKSLIIVPDDMPMDMAAMAFINPPTALRLLTDFVALKPGDWIIQNAANSALGFCIVGLAKHLGLNSINIVRDNYWEKPLLEAGADHVFTENTEYWKSINEITDNKPISLAVNSIGGESVIHLIKAVSENAKVVTVGGMIADKVKFPTGDLIFRNIQLCGFWMDHWAHTHSQQECQQLYNHIFELFKQNVFHIPISHKYDFCDGLKAIAAATSYGRKGKVLITSTIKSSVSSC